MDKCKVIAVTNQKGGVGKTTTTVNLGIGLAKMGSRVLLIDADAQGSLSASLGVKRPDELSETIATVMQGIVDEVNHPRDYGILKHVEGVDFLPANIELSAFEVGLFQTMNREYVLKKYVDRVKEGYDYIIIDCMPSLGMMTINSLVAADSVIIPSQPNFLSTKGLGQLMKTIGKVKRQINPKLSIDGILLTMVDSRTNNAKEVIASLRQIAGPLKIFDSEIPRSVRAAEASLEGISIFKHDPSGKVSDAYGRLTKEVKEIEQHERYRTRSEGCVR